MSNEEIADVLKVIWLIIGSGLATWWGFGGLNEALAFVLFFGLGMTLFFVVRHLERDDR